MRLLVVEDEQRLASGLKRGLEAEGFARVHTLSPDEIDRAVIRIRGDS